MKLRLESGLLGKLRQTRRGQCAFVGLTKRGRVEFICYAEKGCSVSDERYALVVKIEFTGKCPGNEFPFELIVRNDLVKEIKMAVLEADAETRSLFDEIDFTLKEYKGKNGDRRKNQRIQKAEKSFEKKVC